MELGLAQIDITPEIGIELSGFAARVQPSIGMLDPLYAKALYVVDGEERLLWIVCDLLALPREFVQAFRRWALETLDLEPRQVVLTATHTHSGPATVTLHEAGQPEPGYLEFLGERLGEAATLAMEDTQECRLVAVEGLCPLAVDRRRKASAHTDPRVAALGWQREDGSFAAVLLNYSMHAVALGPANRMISADWPGRCAAALGASLPGEPMVVVTNGACGNLNPPFENVSPEQLDEWGEAVAGGVRRLLLDCAAGRMPDNDETGLTVLSQTVPLALEVLSAEQIHMYAERSLRDAGAIGEWGDKFRRAVITWRDNMIELVDRDRAPHGVDVELVIIGLGGWTMIGVNAEVFSQFTERVRSRTGLPVYVTGYSNGVVGYLPTSVAYDEGGYEVELAHIFYDSFRMQRGNLELLADCTAGLIQA